MELKPCKSICHKCGWDDIHLTYRSVGESLKYYSKYSSEYTDLYKVTKEHIHYQCTKCGYTWDTEPMNTRDADLLLREMAEALQGMADIYYGRDNQPIAGAYARKMDIVLQKYHDHKEE